MAAWKINGARMKIILKVFSVAIFCLIVASGCFNTRKGGSPKAIAAARTAESYIGVPYRYGGRDPKTGFDCSGLTWFAYRQNGVDIPKTSSDQSKSGAKISKKQLAPGDLVFFQRSIFKGVDHVGIYLGNGKFVHAPRPGKKVEVRDLGEKYYRQNYHSSRRVIN